MPCQGNASTELSTVYRDLHASQDDLWFFPLERGDESLGTFFVMARRRGGSPTSSLKIKPQQHQV